MKATVNPVDQHVVTLTIEVPQAEVASAVKQAVKRIANQVNIPGFRKGKAPRRIIEANYGKEAVLEEAFDIAFTKSYIQALNEEGITPVTEPEIERVQFEEGKDMIVKATFTKKPEVTLGQYTDLEVEKQDATVTDEQVEAQLERIREQNAKMVVAPEGAGIEKGDFATIDFKGTVDGVAFDGGEGKSYPLEIGSGSFIPGFEDQLVGAKVGDNVTVKVTFPEDYFVKDLAGKEAEFATHIHDIKRKELPELNDEFAKEASSYETIDALKADLRAKMEQDAQMRAIDNYNGALIEAAVKNATVDIPQVMIDQRIDQMIQEMAMNLEGRGLSIDDYLKFSNKTVEDLKKEYADSAAENVRADLVLDAIAAKEGIDVTVQDMNREIFVMAQNFGADPKEVFNIIQKEGRVSMLRDSVARKKAARFIIDHAKGAEAVEKAE